MSLLDQTKREATRLFKIAKKDHNQNIFIKNLSHAREIMAALKGYSNWHAYAESTKKRDFVSGNTDFDTSTLNMELFNDSLQILKLKLVCDFVEHIKKENINLYQKQTHKNIVVATSKGLLSKTPKILDQYPAWISGTTGAGRSEVLYQFVSKYFQNDESCIFMDFKGELHGFFKFYSARLKSPQADSTVKLINLSNHRDPDTRLKGHSIDPINPLVGDENAFKIMFDSEIGSLLHKMCLCLHKQNKLVSADNIQSMLCLPNLIKWSLLTENNPFLDIINELRSYLYGIGITDEDINADTEQYEASLYTHAIYCYKALNTVKIINKHKDSFSVNPDISLYDVLIHRQNLYVIVPALEKSLDETLLASILVLQLSRATRKIEKEAPDSKWSNIIIDSADYIRPDCAQYLCKELSNQFNWVFGVYALSYNEKSTMELMRVSKSYFFMKHEFDELPDYIRLKMLDTLEQVPPIFYNGRNKNDSTYDIKNFKCGVALAFTPEDHMASIYKLEKISFDYKEIKLVDHINL